jgi:transaldolase
MNATQTLHILAHGLWLDNTTRLLLVDVTPRRHIENPSVIGLTLNPTIFDHAIKSSTVHDEPIRDGLRRAKPDAWMRSSMRLLEHASDGFGLEQPR